MFISEPHNDHWYIAEIGKGPKLLWSMMPVDHRSGSYWPVKADDVPRDIRRQAYRKFYRARAPQHRAQPNGVR